MLRSLDKIHRMDLGFDPERVLHGEIALPSRQYADPEEQVRFATQLQRDLNASPGVRAASVMRTRTTTMIEVDGRPTPEELPADVFVMNVGSRYFEALGARVLRGRGLTDDDGHAGSEAAVVNERFAALFFGAEDALGRRIRIRARDDSMSPWLTIVGIGSNVRVGDIRKRDWAPVVHLPYRMDAGPSFGLQILTEGAPHTFVPQLRAVVRALDRDLPVHHARSMAAVLAEGRWWFFVLSGTLGVFALFAVVLAAVGIYAVAACAVAQRTREIGIRIALGAQAHRTVRTALGRVLAYVGVGLLLWTGRRRGRRPGDREPADSGPARRSADPGAGAAAVRCTGRRGVRGSRAPGRLARSVRCAPFRVTHSVRRRAAHAVRPASRRAGSWICLSGLVTVLRSIR